MASSQFEVTEPHTVPITFHRNDLSAIVSIHLLKRLLALFILLYEEHSLTLITNFKMQVKFHASTLTPDN